MKLLKILGHPILLISIFPLLLIEGDKLGGPFLLYILLALPHGASYAVLAVLGVAILLIGKREIRKMRKGEAIFFLLAC